MHNHVLQQEGQTKAKGKETGKRHGKLPPVGLFSLFHMIIIRLFDNFPEIVYHIFWFLWKFIVITGLSYAKVLVLERSENMREVILKLDCELVYKPEQWIEIRLKHGGSLSREVIQHLVQAGREVSLALQHLTKLKAERPSEKVRTKIEIEET